MVVKAILSCSGRCGLQQLLKRDCRVKRPVEHVELGAVFEEFVPVAQDPRLCGFVFFVDIVFIVIAAIIAVVAAVVLLRE